MTHPMMVDLDNTNRILNLYRIAELAKENEQDKVYKACLKKIEKALNADLGKILITDINNIPVNHENPEKSINNWIDSIETTGVVFLDDSVQNRQGK